MDNNPLSILRAQVEAATAGEWQANMRTAVIASTSSSDTVAVVHGGLHDAALIVTAVAIVRRMVSDEGIERLKMAIGSFPLHDDDRGPDNLVLADALPAEGADEMDALMERIALAVLSSLLTGGV